jgi:hypothetical protein
MTDPLLDVGQGFEITTHAINGRIVAEICREERISTHLRQLQVHRTLPIQCW